MTVTAAIWNWLASLDPRIWQAVLAGVSVALGWVFNGRQNRREAASLRAERLRDVHRALYAEIGANLANLAGTELAQEAKVVVQRMQDDPAYVPFLPRENRHTVYDAIVGEIHVLPRTTIDAIVAYYAQLTSISYLIDDIRGQTYKTLPADRKIRIYQDLIALKQQALAFGNHALLMIKTYGDDGPEAAKDLEKRLKKAASTRQAADRSDQ